MKRLPCICIFTGYYHPHMGGVEKYTANLSKFLVLSGFRVIVVTSNTEKAAASEILDQVEVLRMPVLDLFSRRYPIPDFRSPGYRNLMNMLRQEPIDYFIVNTRFYISSFIGLRVAAERKTACMLIEHGTGHLVTGNPVVDFFAARYEHFLSRRIKKHHPVCYGVSEACSHWLMHFGIRAAGVIFNGVDTAIVHDVQPFFRQHFSIPSGHLVYASAGRLIPEKGPMELLSAFGSFSRKHDDVHLFLAGDGPLLEQARKQYPNPRVHITGKLDHSKVMNLFGEADVAVMPSRYPEGLPTVLLEAGLAGCAVIATNVGGSPEVVRDHDTGLLISRCDTGELENAMEELYRDPGLRHRMAENLHKRVTTGFDWKMIVKKMLSEPFFNCTE